MTSLVHELQSDALDSSTVVSDLLRKSLVVARKLGTKDFEEWSALELKGYLGKDEVPGYRLLSGQLRVWNPYRGLQPLIFSRSPEAAEQLSQCPIASAVGEIESQLRNARDNTTFQFHFSKEIETDLMRRMRIPLPPSVQLDAAQLQGILDSVRTVVLEWALKLEEDGILGDGMSFSSDEKQLASSNTYHIETFIGQMSNSQIHTDSRLGEVTMGDIYNVGQGGAIGPNAHAHDITFNQIWNQLQGSIELPKLGEELARLRQAMKKEAVEPEQDIAISEIAKAEQAAKSGNGPKVLEHLKSAGKWALDVATKIGTSLTVEVIKKSLNDS